MPTPKTKMPRAVLPEGLALPDDLAEADRQFATALERKAKAEQAAAKARAALEAAPAEDSAALEQAVGAGKPNPTPSVDQRRAELEVAQARVRTAGDLARTAAREVGRLLGEHRTELASQQRERVEQEAQAVDEAFAELRRRLECLALEAGTQQALHAKPRPGASAAADRMGTAGRPASAVLPSFKKALTVPPELAALERAIAEMTKQSVPIRDRILAVVGEGKAAWADVAAQLEVGELDGEVCAIRALLVQEGHLRWADEDGDTIPAPGFGSIPVRTRYLWPATPPPSATEQALAEHRKAAA